jgi:hypothetical protein
MANDGPGDPSARELIHVTRGSAGGIADLIHLQQMGWRVHRAPDARGAQRILRRDVHRPHAGLLDLRDGFDGHDLASFGPVLSAGNVGWVAGIDAIQLADEPVRSLIRDYC